MFKVTFDSFTKIRLKDVSLYHFHKVGKHASIDHAHAHKGEMELVFTAPEGIAFYVSKNSIKDLKDMVQKYLSEPVQEMLEDRICSLGEHVNASILPQIIKKYTPNDTDASLAMISFKTVSDGTMGHIEEGEIVECGAKIRGFEPYR